MSKVIEEGEKRLAKRGDLYAQVIVRFENNDIDPHPEIKVPVRDIVFNNLTFI